MSIHNGVVVGKDFRPPEGDPPSDWCYLIIDMADEERVTIRLHPSRVTAADVGDRVVFTRPRRQKKRVRNVVRL